MKRNKYIIIFASLVIVIVVAALFILFSRRETTPSYSDGTETQTQKTEDSGIFPIPDTEETGVDTERFTDTEDTVIDTEPEETEPSVTPTDLERKQTELDSRAEEIAAWIEENTPIYIKEAETDDEGNIIAEKSTFMPSVAYFYMDMKTGLSMSYNADTVFYTASIIKAPYIMWVISEIEKAENEERAEGIYDVNSVFVYTEDKYKSGSGIIQFEEYGTEYTYLDLLKLSVTKSDNIAFAEIRNIYGRKGFNEFSKSIGAVNPTKSLYKASATEMCAYMKAIYEYFEGESKYAAMLANWMLSTNHRILIPNSLRPTKVASKYGWDIGAYHDSAVIFDESPYVLVIMTELDQGKKAENSFISSLVKRIDGIHKEITVSKTE